jgi:hypothetical protein
MFPWLIFWAPQLHFPFSGSVAQQIDPNWFFGAINPAAGDARIEKQAFEVASYGRQLGLITEVLIELADRRQAAQEKGEGRESPGPRPAFSEAAGDSLKRLKEIRTRIEQIKAVDAGGRALDIEAELIRLQKSQPAEFALLRTRLQPLLSS